MSEPRESNLKDRTMDSMISNPEPEPQFISKEGKNYFIKSTVYILIDLLLSILYIFEEYSGLLKNLFEHDLNLFLLILFSSITLLAFIIIIILIMTHITICVKIGRYIYIILGLADLLYKIILKIIYFIRKSKNIPIQDIIVFVIILVSIFPRCLAFCNIEKFEKVCKKVDESRRVLLHEKFVEKIGEKVDKGRYSRWSNTIMDRTNTSNKLDSSKD